MRIFTRYILREIVGYALLGGVLFTFMLFMRYLLQLMELAVSGAASPTDILKIIAYLLPTFLTLTLPMAVLVGILLGLSRLAADSEITAMRASGMGVMAFVRIVSIVAVLCWALGLVNSLYIAPRAAQSLKDGVGSLSGDASSLVQSRVQSRVFCEDLKNSVLYVQDVVPGANGAALWHHVFLADLTNPASPHILTANQAVVLSGGPQTLRMDLSNGSRHDIPPNTTDQYDIHTFDSTTVPVEINQQEDSHLTRRDTPLHAMRLAELWERGYRPTGDDANTTTAQRLPYRIEFQSRFSYPTACFVLMLVGVPLGLSSKRGGKGTGFVVTILLVFVYYIVSFVGGALALQGKIPVGLGVWSSNILFGIAGVILIQQMSSGSYILDVFSGLGVQLGNFFDRQIARRRANKANGSGSVATMRNVRRSLRIRFPLILDEYVMGSFLRNFLLVLVALVTIFLLFTFFELIGHILKNRTPMVVVIDYLLNLIPFILDGVTPLCALVAVLITFGTLNRTSELTAMKATGTSLYRVVAPVILLSAMLAAALFSFDENYLPAANRRQEALRSVITGKQAQTFLRPDRQWMSGQIPGPNQPSRIFYYQFFDPYKNVFANLTVFEFDPTTYTLTRRIYASSARWDDRVDRWVFENGWQRTFSGENITSYQPFTLTTFPEIAEQPAYFKKEARQSQEMSYTELDNYINDLKQSGFDTVRLRVQLNRKLAYPLITLVMAILAIPFSLMAGKRGSVAGLATAIGVAIAYRVISAVFENLGDVNSLPAVLAAWSPDLLFAIAGSYLLLRTPT